MSDTAQSLESNAQYRLCAHWLFATAGLVFAMVVIGAITRLTESGLSMVEWRPLIGALPPLNDAEWMRVFELYKQSPEFAKQHYWMGLEEFKAIFFWEWFHRFMGRFVGLFYGAGLIMLLTWRQIPKGYGLPLLGLFILGGLQGVLGWWMVKSGLVDEPSVSHYRLAAHLSMAFLLFSLLVWTGLNIIKGPAQRISDGALYGHLWAVLGVVIVTIFWGAYVAGLDAGLIYNDSFPKMGGHWIPGDMWFYKPFWVNFFENHSAVQFVHRWLGLGSALAVLSVWVHALVRGYGAVWPVHGLAVMVAVQVGLGIATLVSHVWLPLAVLHQAGALLLLLLMIVNMHSFKPLR